MPSSSSPRRFLVATLFTVAVVPIFAEEPPAGPKPVSFMTDVAPVLVRNCVACHNPRKPEDRKSVV